MSVFNATFPYMRAWFFLGGLDEVTQSRMLSAATAESAPDDTVFGYLSDYDEWSWWSVVCLSGSDIHKDIHAYVTKHFLVEPEYKVVPPDSVYIRLSLPVIARALNVVVTDLTQSYFLTNHEIKKMKSPEYQNLLFSNLVREAIQTTVLGERERAADFRKNMIAERY